MKYEFSKGVPVPEALQARWRLVDYHRRGLRSLMLALTEVESTFAVMDAEWWDAVHAHFGIDKDQQRSINLRCEDGLLYGRDLEENDK